MKILVISLAVLTFFTSCEDEEDTIDTGTEQDADIAAFTFEGIKGTVTINKTATTVAAEADETVDLTTLVAEFTLSTGATAKVGSVAQVSKQTANNFSSPVTYSVTSGDGETTKNWTVTVTGGKPTETGCQQELTAALLKSGHLAKCTYIVKSNLLFIDAPNPVTIEAGTVIKFEKVQYGAAGFNLGNKITAVGTEDEPIVFTSAETNPQPGDWAGIQIYAGSRLEYCIFEYGARSEANSADQTYDDVMLTVLQGNGTEKTTIKNCTFRNAESSGLSMQGYGFTAFENNTFINCGETIPIHETGLYQHNAFPMRATRMDCLIGMGEGNEFNTAKGIGVESFSMPPSQNYDSQMSITNQGTPYYLYGSLNLNYRYQLTIEAGTHILLAGGGSNPFIRISVDAVFTAIGTADNHIKFTGKGDQKGYWQGIHLDSPATATLKYCEIANAGANSSYASNPAIAIDTWNNGGVSITDCHIRKCTGVGIYINNTGAQQAEIANNTFEDVDGSNIVYKNN